MYKTLLILKYLRKRRIAWVSLIAVALCTALVLVVLSVMGGWLRMFRQSFHGLSGDIQIVSSGTQGFAYYPQMIAKIEVLPIVGAGNAVPVIKTYGLLTLDNPPRTDPVQVLGYPIDKIGNVNDFGASLYRQHQEREEAVTKLKNPNLTPEEREYFTKLANDKSKPTFDLVKDIGVYAEPLPAGLKFPEAIKSKITYLPSEQELIFHGEMSDEEYAQLIALSNDVAYMDEIQALHTYSDPRRMLPRLSTIDVRTAWPGMIVGDGVANIHKDKDGRTVNRTLSMYRVHPKLTVIGIPDAGEGLNESNKKERRFWVVDDSRTKVYQYDSQTVYVPFAVLQDDLQMSEKKADDGTVTSPPRTSEVDIKLKPGTDLNAARETIRDICLAVYRDKTGTEAGPFAVQTWEDSNRIWLHAIENEKVLMTVLFGLMCVVAVFLIFCIFYMIVVEKTRDIGIVKSVGATSGGVAMIFLGYGLVIGIVGSGTGLLFGWLIVHYINQLHTWLGKAMGVVIWDPQVYLFDKIPNTMNPAEVAVIMVVAICSAVFGAMVPAVRAARLHPVEALRWE